MEVVRKPADMQRLAAEWRSRGVRSVLVPTMGALHAGHLALIEAGRPLGEKLVVSIFVNATQFGPGEDLKAYPRSFDAD